jgi:hypothetical protein
MVIIAFILVAIAYKRTYYDEYVLLGIFGGVLFTSGIILNGLSTVLSPASLQDICEENSICYELVETIAENTNYTEKQITDFFIIVSDDIEAWDAIKMLDSSLTDEQINAIMEISEMKQAE